MVQRRQTWHSVESDGYDDDSGHDRAVYHVCLNCQYLQEILANNHQKRGMGRDNEGKVRRRCERCSYLISVRLCDANFIQP